jgi:prevent-host-death family protein
MIMVNVGGSPMREVKAGEFKAKCLKLLDEVAETGEGFIVTKRGKPVARVLPPLREPLLGALKGTTEIVDPNDDLNSALDEADLKAWEESLERKAASLEQAFKAAKK